MDFKEFPKKRKKLPKEYEDIYELHYKENREGKSVAASQSQKLERWLHKQVAKSSNEFEKVITLEIGAGTLNQLDYEKSYIYDIVEPFKSLYTDSRNLNKVNSFFSDISEIKEPIYNRITSIATFEHILNLPEVIARTCLLFNDVNTGVLSCAIPSQGDMLWKLGYSISTGLEFWIRYKLNYSVLMEYEHVNSANEIEEVLKYFYDKVDKSIFGVTPILPIYRSYECRFPNVERAKKYLQDIGSIN